MLISTGFVMGVDRRTSKRILAACFCDFRTIDSDRTYEWCPDFMSATFRLAGYAVFGSYIPRSSGIVG